MRRSLIFPAIAIGAGCATPAPPPAADRRSPAPALPPAADPCAGAGTWASTGLPTLLTWCTACHSAQVHGDARRGAPAGVDFDTLAGARQHAARIAARVEAGTMPPASAVGAAEAAALLTWLRCGAPGPDLQLPAHPADWDGESVSLLVFTEADPDEPDVLIVRRLVEQDRRPWSTQRFWATPDGAALLSHAEHPADGGAPTTWSFDPGLPLDLPGSHELVVTRAGPEGDAEGDAEGLETWTTARGPAPRRSAHEVTDDFEEVLLTGPDGEELGWHLSPARTLTAHWTALGGRSLEALQIGSDYNFRSDAPLPLQAGWGWVEWGIGW
jgi:hypothetical protein